MLHWNFKQKKQKITVFNLFYFKHEKGSKEHVCLSENIDRFDPNIWHTKQYITICYKRTLNPRYKLDNFM